MKMSPTRRATSILGLVVVLTLLACWGLGDVSLGESGGGMGNDDGAARVVKKPLLEAPPNSECDEFLGATLESMQAASATLAAARKSVPGAGHDISRDVGWALINRGPLFVEMLLTMPPGLPHSQLHRCPDLNPNDEYIDEPYRRCLESAFAGYSAALAEVAVRRDRALAGAASNRSAVSIAPLGSAALASSSSISVKLPPANPRSRAAVSMIEQAGDGLVRTEIKSEALSEFRFYESLYWHVVQEMGCQVIAAYSILGLVPSASAELMSRRVCEVCQSRSQD